MEADNRSHAAEDCETSRPRNSVLGVVAVVALELEGGVGHAEAGGQAGGHLVDGGLRVVE